MSGNPRAVDVTGLHKRYGDKAAVDGLDLHVEVGEIVAVLGPNGAGKTTTVEILEGYRHRDSGKVTVLGEDPQHAGRPWRARVGVVLQDVASGSEATVEELVRHYALFYPAPRDPDEVIAVVGLEEKRRTRVRHLSGGQRRRLDVALGVVGRPELLFLDEPTTGFDPEARHAFWDLIGALRAGGTTILLTTHYLDEAEHLADRVVVVTEGHVVAEGAPATLGGAGAVESVAAIMALVDRTAPPTVNLDEPDDDLGIEVSPKSRSLGPRVAGAPMAVLNDAFGFGGHNVALAFTEYVPQA